MAFSINPSSGWINDLCHLPSTHYNERPANTPISLLVIHCISLPPGRYNNDNVSAFFTGTLDHTAHPYYHHLKTLQVSAHFFIQRTGKITQFVATHHRAWHAGQSRFEGISNCNDYSLGIELEGTDTDTYEHAQYLALVDLVHCLQRAYPNISQERIIGHSDIAPGRKKDPGPGFDWASFRDMLTHSVHAG